MRRATCQGGELTDFYQKLVTSGDENSALIGLAMQELLKALEPVATNYEVWGLTSLFSLVLLAEDDWRAPWHVRVIGRSNCYEIRAPMESDRETWPEGAILGLATSVADAAMMVEQAMLRSGGWKPLNSAGP